MQLLLLSQLIAALQANDPDSWENTSNESREAKHKIHHWMGIRIPLIPKILKETMALLKIRDKLMQ